MRKISEVLRLHFKLGLSVRQSANATGTSRGSVGNYCTWFKKLGVDIDHFLEMNEIEQLISPFFNTQLLSKNLKMEFNQSNLVS